MPKESVLSIIWDSGTSLSITNGKTDFHGTLKPCPYMHLKVKGVAQAIKVHGQGTVLWSVLDEAGMLRTFKIPALYIPDAKVKVLSVKSLGDVTLKNCNLSPSRSNHDRSSRRPHQKKNQHHKKSKQ